MNVTSAFTRRRSLVGMVVCASLFGSLFVVSLRSRSAAQGVDLGNDYINRARDAALTYDFGGELEIVWSTDDGQERKRVAVRSEGGVLSLGDDAQVVIEGPTRFAKGEGGWTMLWAQAPDQPVPSASEKWDLAVRGGPLIAGRASREVAATERDNGRVRERRYFDAITGLLLRREQFDETGRRVRYVTYTRITLPPLQLPAGSAPKVPEAARGRQPKVIHRVPADFDAPSGIGDGFTLNGLYRRPDGSVQLFYSDGLFSASVFEQKGTLDRDALEPGGVDREVNGRFVHQYDVAMGTVLVWERDGLVFTSVSDAPPDELERLVGSFSEDPGFTDQALDYVLGPFGW